MYTRLRRPLFTAMLASSVQGCEAESTQQSGAPSRELPDPPSEKALAACVGQEFGDEDFDWGCCDVWRQQCESEGGTDCIWICNG
jgi:hypothetical protein